MGPTLQKRKAIDVLPSSCLHAYGCGPFVLSPMQYPFPLTLVRWVGGFKLQLVQFLMRITLTPKYFRTSAGSMGSLTADRDIGYMQLKNESGKRAYNSPDKCGESFLLFNTVLF